MLNTKSFNAMASDKRWVNLMGEIKGVSQGLKTLAPRPDRKDQQGPLSTRAPKAANDDGAFLANMLIGAFVGAHFGLTGMAQHAASCNAIDAIDMYWSDRANAGEGNMGIMLGENGAICGGFNQSARNASLNGEKLAWEAYLQDLPKRRILEQNMGGLNRKIDHLEQKYMCLQTTLAYSL